MVDISPEAVAEEVRALRGDVTPARIDKNELCAAMLEALQADNEALWAALDGATVLPMLERARAEAREETATEREALQARVVELEGRLDVDCEALTRDIAIVRAEARAEAFREAAQEMRQADHELFAHMFEAEAEAEAEAAEVSCDTREGE